jgi:hypothetical protein
MMEGKKFDFNFPEKKAVTPTHSAKKQKGIAGFINGLGERLQKYSAKKFGENSKIARFLKQMQPAESYEIPDTLVNVKKTGDAGDRLNMILTIALIAVIYFIWKQGPTVLADIDQMNNDLSEQEQVITMEKQNNAFLEKLQSSQNNLIKNSNTVKAAVPGGDERAEEVMAMLEDIAAQNQMSFDAISIRQVPESQFYYDDLVGVAQPYEYSFTLAGNLKPILSFVRQIRSSLRLMDIMTLEIEKGKDAFKANFVVYAYNIIDQDI